MPENNAARAEPWIEDSVEMRVSAMRWEAEGVISLELSPLDGQATAPFTPGAHIDLLLPNGLSRSYSLLNAPDQADHYAVAVAFDFASRGGSRYIHEQLHVGQLLKVRGPRNHFPLVDEADEVILIAGGIGVTPLLSMMRSLSADGRRYTAYYAARRPARAAYLREMHRLGGKVVTHFDEEQDGRPLDIAAIVRRHPGAHFYCCGPSAMLAAFEAAAEDLPAETVHVEYFAPKPVAAPDTEGTFSVVLNRSGRRVTVPSDQTILQALTAAGVSVTSSCENGVCGSCETKVLAGEIDHRDSVLTEVEQAAGRTMMLCVSRCRTSELVLDL